MDSCRARFLELFRFRAPLVVVWAGGRARPAYRLDEFQPFTQCPHFQYLFGEQPADRIGAMRLNADKTASWCVFGKSCTASQRIFDDCQEAKSLADFRAWCAGTTVFFPAGSFDAAQHAVDLVQIALRGVAHVRSCARHDVPKTLHRARTLKTPEEVERIRVACHVTAESIARLQTLDLVGMRESQLKALFRYYCSETEGCHAMAFPPIAAGGGNTAILHYEDGDRVFQAGDLVLCDMGCRFQGYSADVTRTWFVGSATDQPQPLSAWHVINERVKDTFYQMVAELKSPHKTWDDLTAFVHARFLSLLRDVKILLTTTTPSQDQDARDDVVQIFFPHAIGHHLGIETHDRCDTSQAFFAPGMVVALEIGIYVSDATMIAAEAYAKKNPGVIDMARLRALGQGGVRVEDNYLVTDKGSECLTGGQQDSILRGQDRVDNLAKHGARARDLVPVATE